MGVFVMLLKSFKMQVKVLLERKTFFIMFFLMLGVVLINYSLNLLEYNGYDVIELCQPIELLTLSEKSGAVSYFFMQYYPLLVIIPAGFSFALDRDCREMVFIEARVGTKNYYFGKLLSTFFITFLVFTIPFLIELMLNCIAFPMNAIGDTLGNSSYSEIYISNVKAYFLSELYIKQPYLYSLVMIIFFGFISGILAIFTVAISTFPINFKVLLFLPVYILCFGISMIQQIIKDCPISTHYFDYLRLFTTGNRSYIGFFTILFLLLYLSIHIIVYRSRQDYLY